MHRNKKRKRKSRDDVNEILEIAKMELQTLALTQQSVSHHSFVNIGNYFTSLEAFLFQPTRDEKVEECLVCRIKILSEGAHNDKLLNMISNTSDSGHITNEGMTCLRM